MEKHDFFTMLFINSDSAPDNVIGFSPQSGIAGQTCDIHHIFSRLNIIGALPLLL